MRRSTVAAILGMVVMTGCSLSGLVDVDKPQIDTEVDSKYLDTRAGALGLLNATLGSLQEAVSVTSLVVGALTDELISRPSNSIDYVYVNNRTNIDTRVEPENYLVGKGIEFAAYKQLQMARVRAGHARYFLRRQLDASLNYAISAAYSYEGYAILLLAENLCSGVPLSDVQYGKEAVYGRALSTDSLLSIAISKFDSALAIPQDSLRFTVLAKIGKGRALVAKGDYREAAEAVADVGQDDVFNLRYTETITPGQNTPLPKAFDSFWTTVSIITFRNDYLGHEIVNLEGNNGLVWYTNPRTLDPRVPVDTVKGSDGMATFPLIVRQRKFPTGTVSLKLASWVEAKMIEAEYLLSIDDANWIVPLNDARRTVGLSDTTAPATKAQQIDLLFRERAFWFYLHGTRLSDMRRLVRQYGRPVNSVFPVGSYTRSSETFTYGDAVVFIPSIKEFTENFAYSGCISKNP